MPGVKGRSGRRTAYRMHQVEEVRQKIDAIKIINRLAKHIVGDIKMEPTQVQAANILLKKCIPDLQAVEWNGNLEAGDSLKQVMEAISNAQTDPIPTLTNGTNGHANRNGNGSVH